MIVVTTSWAPETALRTPGMKPHAAPASKPARTAMGMATSPGAWPNATPTVTAPRAPTRNWPPAPMLNRPALKPRATDNPARTSGTLATKVLITLSGLPSDPSMRAR